LFFSFLIGSFYFILVSAEEDFDRIPIEDAEMPRGDPAMLVAFPSEPPERGWAQEQARDRP
jgi:hypothetical protein